MLYYAVFESILKILFGAGLEVLTIVDDTLNRRRGKKVCVAEWQYDEFAREKGPKGYGLCFVITGLAVRLPGITDRVFCLPYAARLWWPPRTNVKPANMVYKRSRSWLGS